jgi:hypothetical protein
MHTDREHENSQYHKEEYAMYKNWDAAGIHVAEFDNSGSCWNLKQQTWRQKDEQNHRNNHGSPISRHNRCFLVRLGMWKLEAGVIALWLCA